MATSLTNKNKMYLTTAGVLAFGVAAYGLGRVYPPLGPSAGTIAPAQRYVSSQVGEGDVTLGDTAVPELMQTDAFELMTQVDHRLEMERQVTGSAEYWYPTGSAGRSPIGVHGRCLRWRT